VTTYKAIAYRSGWSRWGRWWCLEVPTLPGALSQSRRLSKAPAMLREAIALMLDVDEDTIAIDLEVLDADPYGTLNAN
jgi:predicted RNase H-like HicB family nuclease